MHIAIVCPEMHGHLNPMTTLGSEIIGRGHRVSLVAGPRARPHAERAGLGFLPIGVSEFDSGTEAAGFFRLASSCGIAALRQTVRMLGIQTEISLREAPGLFRRAGIDAVIGDQVSPAAATVAAHLGLPFVIACNALIIHQESGIPPPFTPWKYRRNGLARLRNAVANRAVQLAARPISGPLDAYRARHGLTAHRARNREEDGLAQIAQQPEFFDFPRHHLPDHFHYTGPWYRDWRDEHIDFPWDRIDGRPLVYASLGTLQTGRPKLYRAILEAVQGMDLQLVLTMGSPDRDGLGPIPENAIIVSYAPQLCLLKRASAMITHAGLNTVLEGLSCGVPMLCLPVTNDQPGAARRIEWLGAGTMLGPRRATSKRIRDSLHRLLHEQGYRQMAVQCQRSIAQTNGLRLAVDIIEEAFLGRTRVERPDVKNPAIQPGVSTSWLPRLTRRPMMYRS